MKIILNRVDSVPKAINNPATPRRSARKSVNAHASTSNTSVSFVLFLQCPEHILTPVILFPLISLNSDDSKNSSKTEINKEKKLDCKRKN